MKAEEKKARSAEKTREMLDRIAECDPEKLAGAADVADFADDIPTLREVLELAKELRGRQFEALDTWTLNEARQHLNSILQLVNDIKALPPVPDSNASAEEREAYLRPQRNIHDRLGTMDAHVPRLAQLLPVLAVKSREFLETTCQGDGLLREAKQKIETFEADCRSKANDIANMVDEARKAIASLGVGRFAKKFEQTAKKYETTATKWFWGAVVLASLTVAVAILFSYWLVPSGGVGGTADQPIQIDGRLLQLTVTRIAILAIFYLATLWAARNYRAHKHLSVVNRHRHDALETFETFRQGSEDTKVQDAVLLAATRCIFSPSVTGYLGPDEGSPGKAMIEVSKEVIGKSAGD